jgi:hypothetical protein
MKALIFLLILGAAIALLVWRVRKGHEEALLAKRRAVEQRKKKDSEKLGQDMQVIWPVIIKPASGKLSAEVHDGQFAMTSIEYEAVEPKAARQGGTG